MRKAGWRYCKDYRHVPYEYIRNDPIDDIVNNNYVKFKKFNKFKFFTTFVKFK